jgi:hypothetical protein
MYNKKTILESLKRLLEANKNKVDIGDEIHLPDLTMKKKDLLKYLKNTYNIILKED